MKQYWQRLELRIDALSLRERAMAFAIAALALITLVNTVVLDPLLARQKQLSQKVTQDQQQIAALQAEIQARVKSHDADPDAASRIRLENLRLQSGKLRSELTGIQQGLVSPDRMAALLEDLLKKNGRLQLMSLKTLPVSLLTDPVKPDTKVANEKSPTPALPRKDGPAGPAAGEAVYKHGVEIVVLGGYSDIVNYLTQLEAMPWQLFWANARLNVETYPNATLKLTLFTLSLDRKWLNI